MAQELAQPTAGPTKSTLALKLPAIGIIVVGVVQAVYSLWSLMYLLTVKNNGLRAGGENPVDPDTLMAFYLTVAIVFLALAAVMILAALQMYKANGYIWAVAAASLSLVSGVSSIASYILGYVIFTIPVGTLLGLPIGMWALVVLIIPSRRGSFAKRF